MRGEGYGCIKKEAQETFGGDGNVIILIMMTALQVQVLVKTHHTVRLPLVLLTVWELSIELIFKIKNPRASGVQKEEFTRIGGSREVSPPGGLSTVDDSAYLGGQGAALRLCEQVLPQREAASKFNRDQPGAGEQAQRAGRGPGGRTEAAVAKCQLLPGAVKTRGGAEGADLRGLGHRIWEARQGGGRGGGLTSPWASLCPGSSCSFTLMVMPRKP